MCALFNLLLCYVAFYLCNADTVGTFCSGSPFEMIPEVAIRAELPVIFMLLLARMYHSISLALSQKAWLSVPICVGPLAEIAMREAASSVRVELPV